MSPVELSHTGTSVNSMPRARSSELGPPAPRVALKVGSRLTPQGETGFSRFGAMLADPNTEPTLGEALDHGCSHLGPRRPLYATEELY